MSAGRGEETTVQGGVEGAEKQETPTVKFREAPLSPDPPSRRLWRTHVSRGRHGPNSAGGNVLGRGTWYPTKADRKRATVISGAAVPGPWPPGAAGRRR